MEDKNVFLLNISLLKVLNTHLQRGQALRIGFGAVSSNRWWPSPSCIHYLTIYDYLIKYCVISVDKKCPE
jgi:hypothetical protein